MAKAGRKSIDFQGNSELLDELAEYVSSLKHLKENDKRCKQFYETYEGTEISEQQKKWLLTLRRDMNAQRKREALLQEILAKDTHSDLEALAVELKGKDDRDSFFNLQKILDLLVSKKNEKQTFSTKKKALERKIYEQEKKHISKQKMENQKKIFLGALLLQLQKTFDPKCTPIDFLDKVLECYGIMHQKQYVVVRQTQMIFEEALEDPRCPDDYVEDLRKNS